MSHRAKIYIAGPYTTGDVAVNVKTALDAADTLADMGYAPFVPHLTHFWHMIHARPYDFWIELDAEYLTVCDAVLRLPGQSAGADRETDQAHRLNIPVYASIAELEANYEQSRCRRTQDG